MQLIQYPTTMQPFQLMSPAIKQSAITTHKRLTSLSLCIKTYGMYISDENN